MEPEELALLSKPCLMNCFCERRCDAAGSLYFSALMLYVPAFAQEWRHGLSLMGEPRYKPISGISIM